SAHIQLVKDGEEVLICDRNKPVARIVPCRMNDHSEQEQRLGARGVLTPPAIALYKSCEAVVWWTTPVEIASALARLVRMKQLNSSDWAKARKFATALADAWSVIQPSEAVRAKAM